MKDCIICNHPDREEIETALFKMTPETADKIIENISKTYNIPADIIQEHSLYHTSFSCEPDGDSIIRQLKIKEADILGALALEQLTTVKTVGKRIRRFATTSDEEDVRFEKLLSKPVVDLYTNTGDDLRKTMQTIVDIHQVLNGPNEDNFSGLADLARALESSRRNVEEESD